MKRQDLINNAKSAVRSLRGSGEFGRTAIGAATRSFYAYDRPLQLGLEAAFEQRAYRPAQSLCRITLATPPDGHLMHTFFDIDPISPSGRYLATTRVPFVWRVPYVGDEAQVCVIDLERSTCKAVYTTRGWGTQLGANVQWGADDQTLFCNDVIARRGRGISIDLRSLDVKVLEGPIYGLSPDRRYSYSGSIDLINAGQTGYGVPEYLFRKHKQSEPLSRSEGIWRTDTSTGERLLAVSIADLVAQLPDQQHLNGGIYYIYNVKVNPRGDRLLVAIFTRNASGRMGWPMQLVTCEMDGSNAKLAVPDSLWRLGGHHANWHPDSEHIVMNLRPDGRNMGFYTFLADGSELRLIAPGKKGGGHPSINRSGSYLITDAYVSEGFGNSSDEVPIRIIDLRSNQEQHLCYVYTNNITGGRRVDPHPVWSNNGSRICFNGIAGDRRQVFVADAGDLK